jgi:hypothetical protein
MTITIPDETQALVIMALDDNYTQCRNTFRKVMESPNTFKYGISWRYYARNVTKARKALRTMEDAFGWKRRNW